jgi:hypothetical protein
MQSIYNYIPKNQVSTVCSVAAVLYLQFVLHVMPFPILNVLHFHLSTFRSLCAALSVTVFCSSLMCFPGMLFRYRLNNSDMVPVAPVMTGVTFAFTFHMRWISVMRSLYFKILSAYLLITFLSPGTGTSVTILLLLYIMYGGEEKCIQSFGGEPWEKETTWKIQA